MDPLVLNQLATGLSVLAGAVLVKSVMDQKPMAGTLRRCPTCNGTGRVSCMCSRWSDGDVGCRTCAGSGRMACSSCGGSGTGRPIPVQISVHQSNNRPSWAGLSYLVCSLLFSILINYHSHLLYSYVKVLFSYNCQICIIFKFKNTWRFY